MSRRNKGPAARPSVRISLLAGNLYQVRLEPGDPCFDLTGPFVGYDHACGYALNYAVALCRVLRDDTGRLTADQCDELLSTFVASGIEWAAAHVDKAKAIVEGANQPLH